jgi:hypothetical protein
MMKVSSIKKVALSGMLALGLMAGASLALPAEQTSAAGTYTKLLYTVYFDAGSGQGQTLRAQCANSAGQYGALSATAQVTHNARQVNGVWQNRLDCMGTFGSYGPIVQRAPISNIFLGF